MTECGFKVIAQMSTWPISSTYLSWKTEIYSYLYGESWGLVDMAKPFPNQVR